MEVFVYFLRQMDRSLSVVRMFRQEIPAPDQDPAKLPPTILKFEFRVYCRTVNGSFQLWDFSYCTTSSRPEKGRIHFFYSYDSRSYSNDGVVGEMVVCRRWTIQSISRSSESWSTIGSMAMYIFTSSR